jgi:predicted protein tyrosine phosphatase
MIVVTSLSAAPSNVALHGAGQVISILSPASEFPVFEGLAADRHLRLSFHDVAAATPGLLAPGAHDMQAMLGFLRQWNRQTPLLIHCWAGISRSTAAGFIATCLLHPQRDEAELAENLRAASPSATPNPMLVALADEALGREGRMVRAIQAIGRGADAYEGTPFSLMV